MSEKTVLMVGPRCGFCVVEIQDERGNPVRWEVIGMGGKVVAKCSTLDEAEKEFDRLVEKVNNGFLSPGGHEEIPEQEDSVELDDSADAPGRG